MYDAIDQINHIVCHVCLEDIILSRYNIIVEKVNRGCYD